MDIIFIGLLLIFCVLLLCIYALYKYQAYFYLYRIPKYPVTFELAIPFKMHKIPSYDRKEITFVSLPYNSNLAEKKKSTTIIYFHGIGSDIVQERNHIIQMKNKLQSNIIAVEYRGFMNCTDNPTQKKLITDAKLVLNYIAHSGPFKYSNFFLFGNSLGAAVVIHLIGLIQRLNENKKINICGIIIQNTFTSIESMIDDKYSYLKILKPFVTEKWGNCEYLTKIERSNKRKKGKIDFSKKRTRESNNAIELKALFVHSKKDNVIPRDMMLTLHKIYKGPKTLVSFDKKHCDIYSDPQYFQSISNFIQCNKF